MTDHNVLPPMPTQIDPMLLCCQIFSEEIKKGAPKVLEAFVFEISSKSLGAQKKYYCQIKAEILKVMWVCGKSQFE
jgi:hypothetical protein